MFHQERSKTVSCGYGVTDVGGSTYTTASSLGTPTSLTWADDVVYSNNPIGFSFVFNDNTYTSMGISSNGFIWLGSGTCSATQYTPLSSQAGESGQVDGIISDFGTDMGTFSGATLKYITFGTVGSRTFV